LQSYFRIGFDEARGLPVDGLAGPETEAALAAVCKAEKAPASEAEWETGLFVRPRRRAGSGPVLALTPSPGATATFDSQAFRQKIVRIANRELARWGNGAIKEIDPRIRRVLQDYCRLVPFCPHHVVATLGPTSRAARMDVSKGSGSKTNC